MNNWRTKAIVWNRTKSAEFPYQTTSEGKQLKIRINDFPAEPFYTLLVDGKAEESFDDWPTAWVQPTA